MQGGGIWHYMSASTWKLDDEFERLFCFVGFGILHKSRNHYWSEILKFIIFYCIYSRIFRIHQQFNFSIIGNFSMKISARRENCNSGGWWISAQDFDINSKIYKVMNLCPNDFGYFLALEVRNSAGDTSHLVLQNMLTLESRCIPVMGWGVLVLRTVPNR